MTHKNVNRLFNQFEKRKLLDDRSQYDEEDLRSAYPSLTKREAHLLFLKLRRWRRKK